MLEYFATHISQTQLLNLGIGVASIAFLLFLSFLKQWFPWMVYVPGILILVVLGMSFAYYMQLPNSEFPLLGTMPGTWDFVLNSFHLELIILLIQLAVLGCLRYQPYFTSLRTRLVISYLPQLSFPSLAMSSQQS